MPVDLDRVFARGGKELIDLLDYCIRSVQMDPLFVFVAQEYRQHPTTPKAVALYEVFCAPQAMGRLGVRGVLPPLNLQLATAVRPFKLNLTAVQAARAEAVPAPSLLLPPKFLYDAVVLRLGKESRSVRHIKRRYRPELSPIANLPGGKMTAAQRHFVERVWEPNLRPRLVAAGFWRLASIG